MGERTFTLTTTVPVAPHVAIDFLADLSRHRGLHPFLVSATRTGRTVDATGTRDEWSVVERPRLGPLRYRISFSARLTRSSASTLHTEVRPAPRCLLASHTTATATDGGTSRVTETCTVTAPWWLLGYMARQARHAHARTFDLLPDELATNRPTQGPSRVQSPGTESEVGG